MWCDFKMWQTGHFDHGSNGHGDGQSPGCPQHFGDLTRGLVIIAKVVTWNQTMWASQSAWCHQAQKDQQQSWVKQNIVKTASLARCAVLFLITAGTCSTVVRCMQGKQWINWETQHGHFRNSNCWNCWIKVLQPHENHTPFPSTPTVWAMLQTLHHMTSPWSDENSKNEDFSHAVSVFSVKTLDKWKKHLFECVDDSICCDSPHAKDTRHCEPSDWEMIHCTVKKGVWNLQASRQELSDTVQTGKVTFIATQSCQQFFMVLQSLWMSKILSSLDGFHFLFLNVALSLLTKPQKGWQQLSWWVMKRQLGRFLLSVTVCALVWITISTHHLFLQVTCVWLLSSHSILLDEHQEQLFHWYLVSDDWHQHKLKSSSDHDLQLIKELWRGDDTGITVNAFDLSPILVQAV